MAPPPLKKQRLGEEQAAAGAVDRFKNVKPLARFQLSQWVEAWSPDIANYPKGFVLLLKELISSIEERHPEAAENVRSSVPPSFFGFADFVFQKNAKPVPSVDEQLKDRGYFSWRGWNLMRSKYQAQVLSSKELNKYRDSLYLPSSPCLSFNLNSRVVDLFF